MGMICYYVVIWIVCVPGIVIGTVSITFEPSKAPETDEVDISCKDTGSGPYSITWNFGGTAISCDSGICAPDPSPHTYSVSGNVFNLTLSSVTTTNCISYSCTNANDVTDTTSSDLYVAYFDKNDITTTEPGANTDGSISVTTGCVLSATDLTVTWYKIENSLETDYTSDRPSPVYSTARSTCTRNCHTEEDKKVTSGFTHTEYTGSDNVEVEYKVTISHSSYSGSMDQFTWTSAKYRLKARPEYKCKCPLWKCNNSAECNRCWIVLILIITLIIWLGGGVGGGLLIGLCITCRPEALKGCYDCKASDCSECCSKCCQRCDNNIIRCNCCCSCFYIDWAPFWYYILWWTVIGTPVAFGIFIIMKCSKQGNGDVEPRVGKPRNETQSGNPHTGQKKSETKKNKSKDSVAQIENEQHNQGKKHREQPPPPSDAGAATGTTLHGREDSDSAVSREHVHVQESGQTLKQRPMPAIPRSNDRQGHDSKGRGLSANFNDDDHLLIGINTPSQKANALDALPEGTGGEGQVKKLKKKKKKSKDQEDEV